MHRLVTLGLGLWLLGGGCSGSTSGSAPTAGLPTPAAPTATPSGKVVARVGPGWVEDGEFAAAASRLVNPGEPVDLGQRKEILEKLVTEEVLFQEALARGLYRDPKVRKAMVNLLLREEVYESLREGDITPEELEAYYEAHKSEFVVPEKVQIKRIFLKIGEDRTRDQALALAADLRKQLLADPSKFGALAEEHSDDPYKRRGGDIGYVAADGKPGVPPEVVSKAFELQTGRLSEPFEAGDGVNLIVVAARREALERTFEQMKGSVQRKLKNDRFQAMTEEYIAGARAKYPVEIDEALLAEIAIEARPALPSLDPSVIPGVGRRDPRRPGIPRPGDDELGPSPLDEFEGEGEE